MNQIKPSQIVDLEQPLVKVPYEQLRKSFRYAYKYVEKELHKLNEKIEKCVGAAVDGHLDPETAQRLLEELLKQVETMSRKRKLTNIKNEEALHVKRIKTRLNHLDEITHVTSPKMPEFEQWSKTRLNRVIVDYLLRQGFLETAKNVATEYNVEDMVDVQLFAQSGKVEEALENRSCKECLQWCSDNRSGLKKMKSTLEFNLRLQEYIELARESKGMEAIVYAKKYLVPWEETERKKIMQAMGMLPFRSDTMCQPYKDLYDNSRWFELIAQFRADNYALCSLTSHPLLSITLQAGLSALKTQQCYQHDNRNVNCPVCDTATLGRLAEKLPLSHHVNSTIVCRISGKIMNEDNAPMMLPNGRVYSFYALHDLALKNGGEITCPRTGDTCHITDVKKVFIS
ncbi:GID complex subunit containing RING finger motif [Apophysomyces sp. BC1034]|nr:GID complex subunit containing RING finger motif [Apophysomyces sp. BC1015]KAG0179262.1 GID complex subunit containing RING finger motif [Apophysomyces sp. BC1021]KAG0192441.1 GID complex subunit containing RING finger motif [Apophysomyces sp. BC1034]